MSVFLQKVGVLAQMTTRSIDSDSNALQEGHLSAETNDASPSSDYADGVSLGRAIHDHLLNLGFSRNGSGYFVDGVLTKQKIRDLHAAQRVDVLERQRHFVEEHGTDLAEYFVSGNQIDPEAIDPKLVQVFPDSLESRLFRFASLLWSVPVSQGFGRRLRFLVKDRQNNCLIGIFALGDPVFNLSARDNWIGWTHEDRRDRLVHVMDAYVVGAVPPYSQLIGGKLVAALMGSKEVKRAYEQKYLARQSVIRQRKHRARLVLLTTTSALGRSSIYNRLSIPDGPRFLRIGMTKGFGHFHLYGKVFDSLRGYLEETGHPYASGHRFGMGPNWKLRVARAALEDIGIDGNSILKHGIEREVYAIPLAENWKKVLLGEHQRVRSLTKPAAEISKFCLERWMVPRSKRDTSFRSFDSGSIISTLLKASPRAAW